MYLQYHIVSQNLCNIIKKQLHWLKWLKQGDRSLGGEREKESYKSRVKFCKQNMN